MRHKHSGFTLVEILAVLAIIGILSAFAIPSYMDYSIKARVTELFTVVKPAQLEVAVALQSGVPKKDIDSKILSMSWGKEQHKTISDLSISEGNIKVTADKNALGIDSDVVVTLSPDNNHGLLTWKCEYAETKHAKYLPKHCKTQAVAVIAQNDAPPQQEPLDPNPND